MLRKIVFKYEKIVVALFRSLRAANWDMKTSTKSSYSSETPNQTRLEAEVLVVNSMHHSDQ
jgi:hypothetical protein